MEHLPASSAVAPAPLGVRALTGRTREHVVDLADPPCALHAAAAAAFLALRAAARAAGHDPVPVSGFRDFDRQLAIWNAKFRGERALLDRDERPLEAGALDVAARVDAILLWSALPGASRHHWGTDFDVVDRTALAPDGTARLVTAEWAPGGPCAALDGWLARHAADFGFFRPYDRDRGGVQPEPWHLSYAPLAVPALAALTPEVLADALRDAPLLGREAVLERLPELHRRFVLAVAPPPARALAARSAPVSRGARPS